jgi:hypothetical protein
VAGNPTKKASGEDNFPIAKRFRKNIKVGIEKYEVT